MDSICHAIVAILRGYASMSKTLRIRIFGCPGGQYYCKKLNSPPFQRTSNNLDQTIKKHFFASAKGSESDGVLISPQVLRRLEGDFVGHFCGKEEVITLNEGIRTFIRNREELMKLPVT